jgi:small subunit ribosomal protein S9
MTDKPSKKDAEQIEDQDKQTAPKVAAKKVTVKRTAKVAAIRKAAVKAPKAVEGETAAGSVEDAKTVPEGAAIIEAQDMAAAARAKGGSVIRAVGRRKRSIACVSLIKNGKGAVTVNGRKMEEFFGTFDLRTTVMAPLKTVGQDTAVDISAKIVGGGIRGQADALRHGITRCLVELNPTFRTALKKQGFLTRDPRERERKKFGHKSARRSPQWSKR